MAPNLQFFTDGEAYERMMGQWSRAAGTVFLDWLALPPGLRWLDVGCGTGVFTELVHDRCAPAALGAIDPSEPQMAFARQRSGLGDVDFRIGDAQAMPYDDDAFDIAAMALVIGLIPDPDRAVTEMRRVVRPGGTVATYMWDMAGNRFTQQPLRAAIEATGTDLPPIPGAGRTSLDALARLFQAAGLENVSRTSIDVEVSYADFDEYWAVETGLANSTVQVVRAMPKDAVAHLKAILKDSLPTDSSGRIAYQAVANAVSGRVPAA